MANSFKSPVELSNSVKLTTLRRFYSPVGSGKSVYHSNPYLKPWKIHGDLKEPPVAIDKGFENYTFKELLEYHSIYTEKSKKNMQITGESSAFLDKILGPIDSEIKKRVKQAETIST
jgi:hypothetical protein